MEGLDRRPDSAAASAGLLRVQNVGVRFGGIVALDDVSFDVATGQIVGLIGPNGAGKTTLFNCLSRLYQCGSGDILFDGSSLLRVPRHRIAGLGIGRTFQNLALFRTMTVLDNVMLGRQCRTRSGFFANAVRLPSVPREEAASAAKAQELIAFLGLGAVAASRVSDLPFGTQKRVELARALASEPKLLLLDEPASGLNHEEVGVLGPDPRHPRPPRGDGAAGGTPHEPGDERLGQGRGAQFRAQDRRRHAGRSAAAPRKSCRPISGRPSSGGAARSRQPARGLRPDPRPARHQLQPGGRIDHHAARRQRRGQDDHAARACAAW